MNENFGYGYDGSHNLALRTNNTLKQTFASDAVNELTSVERSGTLTVAGSVAGALASAGVNGTPAALYSDGTFATTAGLTLNNGNNVFVTVGTNTSGTLVLSTKQTAKLPVTVNLSYDLNGNLTGDGLRGLEYDDGNQLIRVTVTNEWRSEFSYDGLGRRRITKEYTWSGGWSQTNEVRYVYDGMAVMQERDAGNNALVTYTRGLDLSGTRQGAGGIGGLLARTDASGSTFYHSDAGGNVTSMTDSSGNVVARYLYDPFGNLLAKSGPMADANRYRFSSKEVHLNSGLYYYGYRFYEPNLQRWVNQDPIGERGGMNLYGFVGNNPIMLIDPFGLKGEEDDDPTSDENLNKGSQGEMMMGDGGHQAACKTKEFLKESGKQIALAATTFTPLGEERAVAEALKELKGVPGTYKVCLKNGKIYVGKAVDIAKRLAQHVKSGKWKWKDIKAVFGEEAKTEAQRRIREAERLMEETGGVHPSEAPNVLNERMPPKP